jgi:hypothetical protein
MTRDLFHRVQFLGGPFDGHVQAVRLPRGSLAKLVALPVSREIFQMLSGNRPAPHTPVTSEALYQLDATAHEPCYRFVRSVTPVGTRFPLES